MQIIKKEGFVRADQIKGSLINFVISKREIENHDTYRIVGQLKELLKAGPAGKNSMMLIFDGYEDDPKEIYQIPEICIYVRAVFKKFPEMFYFLSIESYTFAIMANCIFTDLQQVDVADKAMVKFAQENGDQEKVVTVDYYTKNQKEFHK